MDAIKRLTARRAPLAPLTPGPGAGAVGDGSGSGSGSGTAGDAIPNSDGLIAFPSSAPAGAAAGNSSSNATPITRRRRAGSNGQSDKAEISPETLAVQDSDVVARRRTVSVGQADKRRLFSGGTLSVVTQQAPPKMPHTVLPAVDAHKAIATPDVEALSPPTFTVGGGSGGGGGSLAVAGGFVGSGISTRPSSALMSISAASQQQQQQQYVAVSRERSAIGPSIAGHMTAGAANHSLLRKSPGETSPDMSSGVSRGESVKRHGSKSGGGETSPDMSTGISRGESLKRHGTMGTDKSIMSVNGPLSATKPPEGAASHDLPLRRKRTVQNVQRQTSIKQDRELPEAAGSSSSSNGGLPMAGSNSTSSFGSNTSSGSISPIHIGASGNALVTPQLQMTPLSPIPPIPSSSLSQSYGRSNSHQPFLSSRLHEGSLSSTLDMGFSGNMDISGSSLAVNFDSPSGLSPSASSATMGLNASFNGSSYLESGLGVSLGVSITGAGARTSTSTSTGTASTSASLAPPRLGAGLRSASPSTSTLLTPTSPNPTSTSARSSLSPGDAVRVPSRQRSVSEGPRSAAGSHDGSTVSLKPHPPQFAPPSQSQSQSQSQSHAAPSNKSVVDITHESSTLMLPESPGRQRSRSVTNASEGLPRQLASKGVSDASENTSLSPAVDSPGRQRARSVAVENMPRKRPSVNLNDGATLMPGGNLHLNIASASGAPGAASPSSPLPRRSFVIGMGQRTASNNPATAVAFTADPEDAANALAPGSGTGSMLEPGVPAAAASANAEHVLSKRSTILKREQTNAGIKTKIAKEVEEVLNRPIPHLAQLQKAARMAMIIKEATSTRRETSVSKADAAVMAAAAAATASMRPKVHIKNSKFYKDWRRAIACTLMGIRIGRQYRETARRTQLVRLVPTRETGVLTYLLKNHKSQADSNLSQKISKLLDPMVERSKETIEMAERILTFRVRSFARFSMTQRLKLCHLMQYERFPAETLVVKEGHTAWSFYFIMSGQVEVFLVRDSMRHRVNILNAGDSFGAVQLIDDLRTACIATVVECEFLRVDKHDYLDITNAKDPKHLARQLKVISDVPDLAPVASHVNPFFDISTYEPNETIVYEASEVTKIHWILGGTCRCLKVVPFVQKKIQIGFEKAAKQLKAYDGVSPCGPDEEVIETVLTIQDFEMWDHFPGLPPLVEETDEYRFRKDEYLYAIEGKEMTARLRAEYSVIASTKVEVASISIGDFLRMATPSVILGVLNNKNLANVTTAMLQEAYLEKRKWELFKKNVVQQVHRK
ncbi:hypothetical protein BC831DRAFT_461763, partial [Entophlyctis helioformis]